MPVTLHALDQDRQQRLEPLAADPIGRLPQQRQCLAHCLIVKPLARSRRPRHEPPVKHPQCVFAVIAGHPGELIQNLPALPAARCPVALPYRFFQFPACCHAQLPRHFLSHPSPDSLMRGSSLGEATGTAPVAKIASQCDGSRRLCVPRTSWPESNISEPWPTSVGAIRNRLKFAWSGRAPIAGFSTATKPPALTG